MTPVESFIAGIFCGFTIVVLAGVGILCALCMATKRQPEPEPEPDNNDDTSDKPTT